MLKRYWVHLCVQSNTLLTHSRCILHVSQQGLQNTLMYKIYLRRAARRTLHPAVQALNLAKIHTNTHNLYSCGEFANLGRQLELFVRLLCGNQEVARRARQLINCKETCQYQDGYAEHATYQRRSHHFCSLLRVRGPEDGSCSALRGVPCHTFSHS